MATQNMQIVSQAFKSQQKPFFHGGSQVPTTLIDLTVHPPLQKKQKINHYFKKKEEVIDLVSSDSDDEPIQFTKAKVRRSGIIPNLTPKQRAEMQQAINEADEVDYKEIHSKNKELQRKYRILKSYGILNK